ncbi:epidermal growth factor receptor substrate 15-like 1 isoform X2 [Diabrotica virgifera virgifera]|uniref:Epidermal growth factor receptor substrate 15-like 1 n=1 Tax=Diabrotica virgifera virgifera TaxID=50390 RepID=A0ABM5KIL5_DIAVI|nr:epidermal growth factor receptor substrate 15-like 1 isoform X2 [Diabrotica virgifera virgifera]
MAALPSPTQVAGSHSAIYEAYYNVVDPKGYGSIGGMEAARFLKKSGLSDVILSKIWDLSDPGGRGCLDKTGMFVALKLVALVQNGQDLNILNVNMDVPPPKMGDVPLPKPTKPPPPKSPLITTLPHAAVDWTIKPSEREKYDKLFDSLQPANGLIPGNKVKNVLMESKLPFDTLGKIWDLADQDKDGMLNRHEFVVAMHLVYKALEKYAIPNTLPPELIEVKTRTGTLINNKDGIKPDLPPSIIPPSISPVPPKVLPPTVPTVPPSIKPTQQIMPWVVSKDEKEISDALFIKSDVDKDGFVSGHEIKDVFLQSGVPQPVLAHIWGLCDSKQVGKLNDEQFALAMWLVARCLKGIEPPVTLTPEMIPPSFRNIKPIDGLVNNNSRYSNPELDMITKDIEELSREKLILEADITQKEADFKIKSGEIKSLQSELDTLAATLKQLENQKGEAQKRLNDLKAQKSQVDGETENLNSELEEQTAKVDKLRVQAAEQAEMVKAQETELNSKKEQLEGLRAEEERLEKQKTENMKKIEGLSVNLQDTQLNISQAKALITQLQEQTRQMNDAIVACDSSIESSDVSQVTDAALRIKPEFRNSEYKKVLNEEKTQNGFGEDPFSNQNGHTSSGFDDDPFQNDPFKNKDAFSNDQFSTKFPDTNNGFSSDPFGSSFTSNSGQPDPFNAFDGSQNKAAPTESDKDPFGCDPFAVLHAPTRDGSAPPRPTSPSPALPPKKSKNPPPRPAPPRPQPPNFKKGQQSDAFGSDPFGGGGSFADFSNFDAKFTNKPIAKVQAQSSNVLEFTDDPFRNYRYEDPFNITFDDDQPAPDKKPEGKEKFDPFGLDGRQSVPLPSSDPFVSSSGRASAPITTESFSEDQQLAWAASESLKLEEDRRKRHLQEQADLELAITLSKAESKKD